MSKNSMLKSMKLGRAVYRVNKELGYFPYFSMTLRQRIKQKLAVNVAIVGEAGISKSYIAFTLALILDKRFTINQVVYTYSEYLRQTLKLGMGRCMVFDEPSYAIGKRDWYKELNKVLVKTIESQRFLVHPLFIPVINLNLLDKTIRDHLVQYVVVGINRGFAMVYRTTPSQWEDKTYHRYICTLKLPLIGGCQWKPKRDSCLGCKYLHAKHNHCMEFRAQYERKKATIQDQRYEQAEADAMLKESKDLTDEQIAKEAYQLYAKFTDADGNIDVKKLRIVLRKECKIKIGFNKSYDIKALLQYNHPEDFPEPD